MRERLTARDYEHAVSFRYHGAYFDDDMLIVALLNEVDALRAELAEARRLLKPFLPFYDSVDDLRIKIERIRQKGVPFRDEPTGEVPDLPLREASE